MKLIPKFQNPSGPILSDEEYNKALEEEMKKAKAALLEKQRDGIVQSNDNLWVESSNPLIQYHKNPHLEKRGLEGAKSHSQWIKDHPNIATWETVLGAVPFAVATAPLVSAGWTGLTTLGDAAAATAAGKAITAGLVPFAKAASTKLGGAHLYSWADMGLRSAMLTQGLNEVSNDKFTPETAINLTPALPVIVRTPGIIRNLQPQEIRNHLYITRSPVGYNNIMYDTERWIRSIFSGKKANIENPTWAKNSEIIKGMFEQFAYIPENLKKTPAINKYIQNFADHAYKARVDAWRMYNRLPQKYDTFTPNLKHPGTFTDVEGINTLKFIPPQIPGRMQYDFVNGSGGYIGIPEIKSLGNKKLGKYNMEWGLTTTKDRFDLNPFERQEDRLSTRVRKVYTKNISDLIYKLTNKMRKISDNLQYDSEEINAYLAAHKDDPLIREIFEPDMFPNKSRIKRGIGEWLYDLQWKLGKYQTYSDPKFLKWLDNKVANIEVSDITGGKPFVVQYDIPWTKTTYTTYDGKKMQRLMQGTEKWGQYPDYYENY